MINKYRKLRGLTQEQLAEMIEISTRQLQRLEKETDIPSLKTLQKLVITLNINEKDLSNYVRTIKKED